MHVYMQELLVPLFKSLLIHIVIVPPGNMQLTVVKILSQNSNLCVLALSFYIFLHGLYVQNGLAYNRAIYAQYIVKLLKYRNQCNNI